MDAVVAKLKSGEGPLPFTPTIVDRDKYQRVVAGRNTFALSFLGLCGVGVAAYLIPLARIRSSGLRLMKRYCHGRVLDLSPKTVDGRTVALYESTPTVRVEFLVQRKILGDDEAPPWAPRPENTELAEYQRDLSLCHLVRHDPEWVGSSIVFDVRERGATTSPEFRPYDTVVVRHDLCNDSDDVAMKKIDEGTRLLRHGGMLLVMEVGQSTNAGLRCLVDWFRRRTRTSMSISRDYATWIQRSDLKLVTVSKTLFGTYHTIAWKKT